MKFQMVIMNCEELEFLGKWYWKYFPRYILSLVLIKSFCYALLSKTPI